MTTTTLESVRQEPVGDGADPRKLLAERLQLGLEQELLSFLVKLASSETPHASWRAALREEALRHLHPPGPVFSDSERMAIADQAVDDLLGWAPFEKLWRENAVEELLIHGPHDVLVDRHGRLERVELPIHDDATLLRFVARLCAQGGVALDSCASRVAATLPDGSRLQVMAAPFAASGMMVSLRRATARPPSLQELSHRGLASSEMLEFLTACVKSRLTVIIAGPAGSGKTELLGALARQIPGEERVATVEHTPELHLPSAHTMSLVAAPTAGRTPLDMPELLRAASVMRPDRLILGECRGQETAMFLDRLSAGHDGDMTTVEASSLRDALVRLETLALRAFPGTPVASVRRQIVNHVAIVVVMNRARSGHRRITEISEVAGMESDSISTHPLFRLLPAVPGKAAQFESCGNTPNCLERLRISGNALPPAFFQRRALGTAGDVGAKSRD